MSCVWCDNSKGILVTVEYADDKVRLHDQTDGRDSCLDEYADWRKTKFQQRPLSVKRPKKKPRKKGRQQRQHRHRNLQPGSLR